MTITKQQRFDRMYDNILDWDKKHPSITWARWATGYKATDLQERHYDETLDLFKYHFLTDTTVCKKFGITDQPAAQESFLTKIVLIMRQGTSIVLLNNDDEVIGTLLLLVVDKLNFGRFSRSSTSQGAAYGRCMKLTTEITKKIDIFCDYKCDFFMRFNLLCVRTSHRGLGLGLWLMRCGLEVARSMRIPVAIGIFGSSGNQKYAEKLGFQTVQKIRYKDWHDKVMEKDDTCRIQDDSYCALMVAAVPVPIVTEKIMAQVENKKADKPAKAKKGKGKKK